MADLSPSDYFAALVVGWIAVSAVRTVLLPLVLGLFVRRP
jgi:hypothetical protein